MCVLWSRLALSLCDELVVAHCFGSIEMIKKNSSHLDAHDMIPLPHRHYSVHQDRESVLVSNKAVEHPSEWSYRHTYGHTTCGKRFKR